MPAVFTRRRMLAGLAVVAVAAVGAWQAGAFSQRQTLPGRLVDYHAIYDGLWDVACDTAMDGSDRGCYLQYVDVYRPRPEFAAAMIELIYHPGAAGAPDPHLRFDIEPGLKMSESRLRITGAGTPFEVDVSGCRKNSCFYDGDAARRIVAAMRDGTSLEFEIEEGRATPSTLNWPLGQMAVILDDLAAQRVARGLP